MSKKLNNMVEKINSLIEKGGIQPVDANYRYGNNQKYYITNLENTAFAVAEWTYDNPGKDKKGYGIRSVMNALFNLAVSCERNPRIGNVLLILLKNDYPVSDRARAALHAFEYFRSTDNPAMEIKEINYLEKSKTVSVDNIYCNLHCADEDSIVRQVTERLESEKHRWKVKVAGGLSQGSSADLVIFHKAGPLAGCLDIVEAKKSYLHREAFAELMQYLYTPLYHLGKAGDPDIKEPTKNSGKIWRGIYGDKEKVTKIRLIGLGIVHSVFDEFEFMLKNFQRSRSKVIVERI